MNEPSLTQFTLTPKQSPTSTLISQNTDGVSGVCQFCQEHLRRVRQLRSEEMRLELEVEKIREALRESERVNRELISQRVLTYEQYRQKMEQEGKDGWNRLDMEAQLAEANSIIQLLLNNKGTGQKKVHREERAQLVIKNLGLQEKIMIRDRIIAEKNLFPIYQYDSRVLSLRKAVVHWYRKAQQQSLNLKQAVNAIKKEWLEFAQNMSEQFSKEMATNKNTIMRQISHLRLECKKDKSQTVIPLQNPQSRANRRKEAKAVSQTMKTSVRHFR